MRARIAGNFPCASCTVPVHTSCSGSLPGPFRACSSRPYSLVQTPELLADVFSGVRIGEERRNVLIGGRQLLARWEYRVNHIFLSRVFLYFFLLCSVSFPVLRPLFAVLSSSRSFSISFFLPALVHAAKQRHTPCMVLLRVPLVVAQPSLLAVGPSQICLMTPSPSVCTLLLKACAGFFFHESPVTNHESRALRYTICSLSGDDHHADAR